MCVWEQKSRNNHQQPATFLVKMCILVTLTEATTTCVRIRSTRVWWHVTIQSTEVKADLPKKNNRVEKRGKLQTKASNGQEIQYLLQRSKQMSIFEVSVNFNLKMGGGSVLIVLIVCKLKYHENYENICVLKIFFWKRTSSVVLKNHTDLNKIYVHRAKFRLQNISCKL